MYSEIELIGKITCKETRVRLLLLFLKEYAGLETHIKNVGLSWGAGGEESRASFAYEKCCQHIEKLNNKIVNEITNG
jgi:hypothetical protein